MYLCFHAGIQFIEIKTMATASQWKQKTEKHQLPELRMHDIINKEPTRASIFRSLKREIKHWQKIYPVNMVNTNARSPATSPCYSKVIAIKLTISSGVAWWTDKSWTVLCKQEPENTSKARTEDELDFFSSFFKKKTSKTQYN